MEHHIGIYTTSPHSRIKYIAQQLSAWWGVAVSVNPAVGIATVKLQYGNAVDLENGTGFDAHYPQHSLMLGEDMSDFTSLVLTTTTVWPDSFDPFAAIFFCLSRYEEYQSFTPDQHGRFPATASVAHQQGWLQKPMAVIWADQLYNYLRKSKVSLPIIERAFELMPSYDVDIAWAYRYRGWRGIARFGLELLKGEFVRTRERIAVLLGQQQDPFDVFDQLQELHENFGLKASYFWLLAAKRTRLNPNVNSNSAALIGLIEKVSEAAGARVGIHPSYFSLERPELIEEEMAALQEIVGHPIRMSRQHFLRFRLPTTYRALCEQGIKWDGSMGYADSHGWRAASHLPFHWYDLEREEVTDLLLQPFPVMDATLRHYLKLDTREARAVLDFYLAQLREIGGPLQLLWHNSSFAKTHGWGAYGEMYFDFLKNAAGEKIDGLTD